MVNWECVLVTKANEKPISMNPKVISQYDLLKQMDSGDQQIIDEIKKRLGSNESLREQSE